MSADWEEVKRLAADFQRAQLSSTVQRLSERNCIEIVKKLIELKLIDVIFTADGKEYLTPQRLLKEIKDELIVAGGRIQLYDLAEILGVDFNHVEEKAFQLSHSERNTKCILGQLITKDYLDHIAEEVNEKLKQVGQVTVGELTKVYDLPGNFLLEVIRSRLGTIIDGQVDSTDSCTFFTKAFVDQHAARVKGALSAITRPVTVSSLINHFRFPESLFYTVAEELIKSGRIAGTIIGGRSDRALYIPNIFAKSQNDWVDSFYKQNGYLEYDALTRLGIQDPKSFVKTKFKDEPLTFLNTCCIGGTILNQVEATIEEALNCGTWADVTPVLPSILSAEDAHRVITVVSKKISKQGTIVRVYCDTIVVSEEFLKACHDSFSPLMTTKAQEDIAKKPHLFAKCQPSKVSSQKKEDSIVKVKQDKKEERKKKSTGGKAGGGFQGRETKTKAVKKKHFAGRGAKDSDSEDESTNSFKDELNFMDVSYIEGHFRALDIFRECPEELVSELAAQLQRPLTLKYREVAASVFESSIASSSGNRKKLHSDYQEKFSSLLSHIIIFEKGIKLFSGDTAQQMVKHLLKTLCTDLVNMVVNYLAQEHGICTSSDFEAALSSEARNKLITMFNEELKQPLLKLHNSLVAKTLEDFHTTIETVFGVGICDMIIRKPDKKKERLLLANHRQSLIAQLSEANEPALCLHLTVLLIFQSQTHNMLHASGKFVPHIVGYLQKQVPLELCQLLATYQESVIKKLTANENKEDSEQLQCILNEEMPKIKEAALTFKKTSVSEADN